MPRGKVPAVTWDTWLDGPSPEKIGSHWAQYPDHEIGFIVGDDVIVFDADSPDSIAALAAIEKAFNVTPTLVVKTTKGEHHYYRRAKGTSAKSDSHSTDEHPDRIDVKTGRALVVLPPSTGKTVAHCEAETVSELTEVGQDFVDAVYLHNGRMPPRPSTPSLRPNCEPANDHIPLLQAIVRHIDPDSGYDDWLHVGMALYFETGGNDEGLALFDAWSSTGTKYKGAKETEAKWRSFRSDPERTYKRGTLIWMAEHEGYSLEAICAEVEPFDICGGQNGTF